MVSNHPLENPKITHFLHGVNDFNSEDIDMFEFVLHKEKMKGTLAQIFVNVSSKMYEDPVIKMLYEKRKEFDLIIMNDKFNNVSDMVAKLYWQNLCLFNLFKSRKSLTIY